MFLVIFYWMSLTAVFGNYSMTAVYFAFLMSGFWKSVILRKKEPHFTGWFSVVPQRRTWLCVWNFTKPQTPSCSQVEMKKCIIRCDFFVLMDMTNSCPILRCISCMFVLFIIIWVLVGNSLYQGSLECHLSSHDVYFIFVCFLFLLSFL